MSDSDLFAKLRKEGKLKLVEPSEEIKEAYLKKSESHLASAKLLLGHGKLEEAVSTAYYSMYHSPTALLFRAGIKCENHAAAIILLEKVFNIDNSDISRARRERGDKQYYTDFHITEKEVRELIQVVERFNSKILDFVERLTNEKIAEFRERAKKLLGGK